MDLEQAAEQLSYMYNNAPKGEAVTFIHLFGIKYAEEINALKERGVSVQELVKKSGLSDSYKTEVSKGIKLANYVNLKTNL